MNTDTLTKLTDPELTQVIATAQGLLQTRAEKRKSDAMEQIRQIAATVQINHGHLGDKPVTTFWKGLDIAGIIGGVSQGASELADRDIDSLVKVAEGLVGPQPVAQFLPADNLSRTFEQNLQKLQGLLLHSDSQAGFAHFTRFE